MVRFIIALAVLLLTPPVHAQSNPAINTESARYLHEYILKNARTVWTHEGQSLASMGFPSFGEQCRGVSVEAYKDNATSLLRIESMCLFSPKLHDVNRDTWAYAVAVINVTSGEVERSALPSSATSSGPSISSAAIQQFAETVNSEIRAIVGWLQSTGRSR